jgi:hypothetical protein
MNEIILRGIDAANPLGFLTALGALRLLSFAQPNARLHWISEASWRPALTGLVNIDESSLPGILAAQPSAPVEEFAALGKNITVPSKLFAEFANHAAIAASPQDRRRADFASAFGSEACKHEKLDRIECTDLCFITGSGHQDFLDTMKGLRSLIEPRHLGQTLFHPWKYGNKGLSFRWDPTDAREYALRWKDPGPEGASTEWGANFLAAEALPLFPTHPGKTGLQTTAVSKQARDKYFTWPIWTSPLNQDAISSLISLPEFQKPDEKLDRNMIASLGIAAIYRCQRVRIGDGANFKVSFRPSRAL